MSEQLDDLMAMVMDMDGPSREIDAHLDVYFRFPKTIANEDGPGTLGCYVRGEKTGCLLASKYTSSLDAVVTLVPEDWWWRVGLCHLSGDASIGPDYNGPNGDRLHAEFPAEEWDGKFDADLRPGDGNHRMCQALLICILSARIKMQERKP